MDPDMEFNALSALYQSVVQDMKQSYPAWEMVGQRAQKLSAQLRATAACLAGFVDSVQAVSDYANNLKGAARDMGVCMTRVCMRERALEHRLRAVADALADETAVSIQQRAAYWKQRTAELDKTAAKHVKKVRTRKGRPDPSAVAEQRQLCSQILSEQRTQFSFFIGTLMPVLNAEISLLDEGSHIRQVVDNLDSTVKLVDGHTLVQTILGDVSQGADNAWRQCLTNAARAFRNGDSGGEEAEDNDMTPQAARPHTISGATRYTSTHCGLTSHTFVPPPKPPLQRRPSERSITKTPTFCTGPSYPTGSSSCSSSDAASSAALIAETLQQIDQLGSDLESYCVAADQQQNPGQRVHSEYAALRSTNGCEAATNGHAGGGSGVTGSTMQNGIRIRGESSSRPPPPARRSSTITSATPTAPSIAEARMSMGSVMGSRQSLNSTGLYCPHGSNQDLRFTNVNPYNRPTANYKI
ncbi:hypothetical protein ANCCEY_11699 [Ancylostoma ceylanicum]|uniref:IMD domain-containing protein n=1 Tax=Ancylostoma ceylanicum TaxID=53326 RepID=A0A0D6LGZ4_9BILA|nr:hypothetical protein ANCCEY_11699 [Ancylostoma ceylanicum]